MHPSIIYPIVILTFYICYSQICLYLQRRKFSQEHGCLPPRRLPQLERILGIDKFLENYRCFKAHCLLPTLKNRFDSNGNTWSATIAGNSMVFTIEPENLKAVFATQLEDFDVGWHRRRAAAPTMGNFVLNADGREWHHYRTMLRPAFARRQISDYRTFKHDIGVLISRIPRDGSTVDMAPLLYKLALSLGTTLLFDESMDSLNPGWDRDFNRFLHAFQYANRGFELRVRMGILLPIMPRDKEYEACNKVLHEYANAFVQKALKYRDAVSSGKVEDIEKGEGRYVFLRELAKDNDDPIRLRDHMLGMLLAGSETTATLLTSCLWILSHKQEFWATLRDEVLLMEGEPNYEKVKSLKKLNSFINEVLRLYPVIPMWNRLANKDTTIPTGGGPDGKAKVFIPKGTFVATNTYCLHRRKDLFGPDAEEFRPERWETLESQGNWTYMPFSGGPRICIGQQYALMEVSYTLVRLLQEFKNIESRDPEPWLEKIGVTYANGNGAKVSFNNE